MQLNYAQLPPYMQGSVRDYIENGYPIEDFLTAVFSNDLVRSFEQADDTNAYNMQTYVRFLHNAPIACWGSLEKVQAWQDAGGLNELLGGGGYRGYGEGDRGDQQ